MLICSINRNGIEKSEKEMSQDLLNFGHPDAAGPVLTMRNRLGVRRGCGGEAARFASDITE